MEWLVTQLKRLGLRFIAGRKRSEWTLEAQVRHLHVMLMSDNRWLAHDPTAAALTQRYLDALAPDWYKCVHPDSSEVRKTLELEPNYTQGLNPQVKIDLPSVDEFQSAAVPHDAPGTA